MTKINFDQRAVTIDGQRTLLLSGAIHYPRSTPTMWPDLMKRSREAGLNAIETYVFWNLHERRRGVFDLSDRLDLLQFCRLAQENDLHVILRIGPYICAETNYGGFPAWLRDVPGIRMRTYNEPFMRETERWVRLLCDYLRPMFAPRGGPIILAQIENEYANIANNYGEAGLKYLQWSVELARSLDLGIPWIMCEGAMPGAIETLNGYSVHERVDEHRRRHPGQPLLWTENWPGWYDTWGHPHHVRTPEDVAYAVARFFAAGGTGMNYYMWHGGTNFDREAMYLQTTSYDFNAPLDEFGLPTTKAHHLTRLHHILSNPAHGLLTAAPPKPRELGAQQVAYTYGGGPGLTFLCNDDPTARAVARLEGQEYALPARSVSLISNGRVLMNTAEVVEASLVRRTIDPIAGALSSFSSWPEPLPHAWPETLRPATTWVEPIEQLKLTHDETDYCWYSTRLIVAPEHAGQGVLTLESVADVVHVFVDGQLRATTATPLKEERGPIDSDKFAQRFTLNLEAGEHDLSLLCCAIGLIKGDWMIGQQNMAEERKGLWGAVRWQGQEVAGPWTMRPGLVGEHYEIFATAGGLLSWDSRNERAAGSPLRWWRAEFARPAGDAPLVVDLRGMNKGLAWLNGRCLGRYWLVPAADEAPSLWQKAIVHEGSGQPTQRYYHLPLEWLEERNVLVLFEELGSEPSVVQLCRWV
ncbi:MAG: beta-galactosidase [Armatimonadota bacterium]|nr:beta-galactosidase [Armatimonadota bacterium]